jgi:two-component system, NtrC family, sensor kinase
MNEKRDSQQMMAVMVDVDEEFRARVNKVFDAWYGNTTDFEAACVQLERLREEALSHPNPVNPGSVDNILGVMNGYRSNYDESIAHFTKAKELFEKHQAWRRMASCSLNLGETYRLVGNFARAQTNFHQTYTLAKTLNDLELQAIAITNEGLMLLSLQSYQRAKQILEEALTLILETWHPEDERIAANRIDNLCEIYYAVSKLYLHEKNLLKAWEAAKLSLNYAKMNARPLRIAHANRALGTVMTRLTRTDDEGFSNDPDTYYQISLDAFKSVNAESEWAKTLYAQGISLAERGKKQAAAQNFQQAILVFNKLSMWQEAAQVTEAQIRLL